MALASGADVKFIVGANSYELKLAKDVTNYFNHTIEPNWVARVDISGAPGKQILRPDVLTWSFEDWSGGEGSKFYDANKPTTYWKGGPANSRNIGELDAPPLRGGVTKAANATPNKLQFVAAGGNLYLLAGCGPTAGGADHFFESTDATSWTSKNLGLTTGNVLTAMCSDGTYVYASSTGAAGVRKHRYFNTISGANGQFAADAAAATQAYGMAFLPIASGGLVFLWTGRTLWSYNVSVEASFPVTPSSVYLSGIENIPPGTRGDVVACENSVVFFWSADGQSRVWEHGLGANAGAHPLWNPPKGFVIKAMDYALGNVFFLGDYLGKKGLFALSLVSHQPLFLGYIRPTVNLSPADIGSSFGAELLVLSTGGHLFSYDIAGDTYSEIDDMTADGGTFAAVGNYKGLRLAARYTGSTIKTFWWSGDDGTLSTSGVGSIVESPAWDFGLPMDNKILAGFHVVSSPLSGTDKVEIGYDLNETGSYTTLNQLTSGRSNFLPVNVANGAATDNPAGRLVRFKVTTYGAAKVYSITVEAEAVSVTEEWEIALDLRPEKYPRSMIDSQRASLIRQELTAAARAKNPITFQWGFDFEKQTDAAWDGSTLDNSASGPASAGYQSHSVVIDAIADRTSPFQQDVKGVVRLKLRRVRSS